jgi:uncharacterized protein YjbI with pentapeptide repeats
MRRVAAAAALLFISLLAVLTLLSRPRVPASAATLFQASPDPKTQLELDKLHQEILNLQRQRGFWGGVAPAIAPLATAVVAIAGLYFTVRKQNQDRRQQIRDQEEAEQRRRDDDVRQQEKDRLQRESETLRLFLEGGKSIGENMDSPVPALRASAVASISTFLGQDFGSFHHAVFMLLVGNLRSDHAEEVQSMLLRLFEKAIRLRLRDLKDEDRAVVLDLNRTRLARVDLSGLPLNGADVAFADLRRANLKEAQLRNLHGIGAVLEQARLSRANLEEARMRDSHCGRAQFHGTRLVSARFEGADLKGAQFYQARMQGMHLNEAHLEGARFEQADVSDAIFKGAHLDHAARESLVRAENWCNAEFDDGVLEQLESLAGRKCPPAKRRRAHSPTSVARVDEAAPSASS